MRLFVAFSRSGEQKTYVQDLLRKEAAKVWSAIEAGAMVYVCGDGSRMEPDVRRALVDIACTQGGLDASAAEARLDRLAKEQRYVLDVWAGN